MDEVDLVFHLESRDNVLILTPQTELSEVLVEALVNETPALVEAVEKQGPNLVVDLRHTTVCGTDFLGLLLKLWKRIRPRHGKMALCNVSPHMAEVLSICDLDRMWPIKPDVEQALAAVSVEKN